MYKLQTLDMIGKASKLFHLVRLLSIFRVFKVIRHLASLRSLLGTLRRANRELGLVALVSFMALLVISTLIYYTEKRAEEAVTFADAFWYSLMTMTTVGYGLYILTPRNHSQTFLKDFLLKHTT